MDVIEQLKKREEVLWLNPGLKHMEPLEKINGFGYIPVKAAQNRFMRYLPYIAEVFPETAAKAGVIESPLLELENLKGYLNENGARISGRVFLKDDARMPIAGSVKARGGIHEVMKIAELLAQKKGFLPSDDHKLLNSGEFRQFFGEYTIQVGSTGNLGLAIGRTAAAMGFQVIVHMSVDAKQWKKDLLRSEGVTVKEYDGDYSQAVEQGREAAKADENSFFIDDENSQDLFFGYSTAVLRLKAQFRRFRVPVDHEHPLFLYLPCGVGGAPGGITFGMKEVFGDDVHCFFAEPVEAPCFLLGMATGEHEKIRVQDIGLTGKTAADGLAVGRPSGFSCNMMENLMSGDFTVSDQHMLRYQQLMKEKEEIRLEPSACAGFAGLESVERPDSAWAAYIDSHDLRPYMAGATHVVWGTGGGLMPEE